MMRRTGLAVGHSRAHAAQGDRITVIRDVRLDLLERAPGQERRSAANERKVTAVGKAGSDTDHVLLSDADIDDTIRKQLLKLSEVAGADAVVADRDDPFVFLRKRDESLGESLTAIEEEWLRAAGSVHYTSSF